MSTRVLFLNHSATMAGAEFCLMDIATNMRDSCRVALFEDGLFRVRLEEGGVPVTVIDAGALHSVRRDSRIPSPSAIISVWKVARKIAAMAQDFDVIHANSQKALIVGSVASRLSGKPLVWHLHDIMESPFFSRLNVAVDVFLANHFVSRVITVSNAAASAFIRQDGKADRIHVVYNGIDVDRFTIAPGVATEKRAELGLGDVPLVGCFSRLAEWKGQHVLIESLARIPEAHVVLVGGALFGEQAYERHLHELVRSRGLQDRVHFLGNRHDVPELMQTVDLVVHPSTAPEPFARTLIESMLSMHAPVASACGGVPELIEHGVTGFLFSPGSVDGLTTVLEQLLRDPDHVDRVARAAHDHAVKHFAMPQFVRAVSDHLRAVAGASKLPPAISLPREASA